MGWADCGRDRKGRRIGYAFTARCDHRGCRQKIDRGLAYVCGGMHNADYGVGCGGYFCPKHLSGMAKDEQGKSHRICEKCAAKVGDGERFFCPQCARLFTDPARYVSPCCGEDVEDDDHNCRSCGEALAGMQIPECPHCGNTGSTLACQPDLAVGLIRDMVSALDEGRVAGSDLAEINAICAAAKSGEWE